MSKVAPDRFMLWIDAGWQPTAIGFAPSKEAWDTQIKKMKLDDPVSYPVFAGSVTNFATKTLCDQMLLVTFNRERFDMATPLGRIGIVVHECAHVWQYIQQNMGMKDPDMETEAYSLQALTQNMLRAIEQAWGYKF